MVNLFFKASNLLLFLIAMISFSCESGVLDLDVPYGGDRLVLNGVISTKGVTARLTRSQKPTQSSNNSLSINGQVWLCDSLGNILIELENLGDGNYMVDITLAPLKGFILKAKASGFQEVISEIVTIPVECIPISFSELRIGQLYGREAYFLDIQFNDPPYINNYYLCEGYRRVEGDIYSPLFIYQNINADLAELCDYGPVFPDRCFSGRNYTYPAVIPIYDTSLPDSITIEFGTVNEGFYCYFNSISRQPEGALLLFQQPFPYLSNIKNGYGMVVAKNTALYEFGR